MFLEDPITLLPSEYSEELSFDDDRRMRGRRYKWRDGSAWEEEEEEVRAERRMWWKE